MIISVNYPSLIATGNQVWLFNNAGTTISGHQYDPVNKELFIYGTQIDDASYMLVFD